MTIAVVGTGSIGRRHIRNLLTLGYDTIAVSEHSQAVSMTIDDHDVRCVSSLETALASGVSAVFIGNPTSLHAQSARDAIAAGVDVYLEKQAATTGSECAELASRAGASGVVVAIGQQMRFHPLLARVHEILESQRLGTILAVEANLGEHLADYHPDEDYRRGYAARRELGGGVLLTQIHLVDLLVWLFGPIRSLFALGGHRSELEVDVEDSVSFLGRSDSDVPIYGHLDYVQRPKRSQLSVTGSDGRIDVDLQSQTLTFMPASAHASPEIEQFSVDRNELFVAATNDFLGASASRRPPACGLDEATEVLYVVDAIKESMRSGRTVAAEQGSGAVVPVRNGRARG